MEPNTEINVDFLERGRQYKHLVSINNFFFLFYIMRQLAKFFVFLQKKIFVETIFLADGMSLGPLNLLLTIGGGACKVPRLNSILVCLLPRLYGCSAPGSVGPVHRTTKRFCKQRQQQQ